jgi:hypothetical protein
MAAIVAPADVRNMAMMRACLVSGRAALLRDPAVGRAGILILPVFRAAGRLPALGLDLGLVMGSSEVCATLSAAPPQPHLGIRRQGKDPEAHPGPAPVATQQRSNQA